MWGIDCAAYTHTGLLDQVRATWGEPGFVGRYHPDFDDQLDNEIENCRVLGLPLLCLWNGDPDGRYVGGDYQTGFNQGVMAALAWKASGAPPGTAIISDQEQSWFVSGEYDRGFIEGVHSVGYTPAFYLNPVSGNNHAAAYQYARARTPQIPCVYFTAQNELQANSDGPIAAFATGVGVGNYAAIVPGYGVECVYWQTWEMPARLPTVDLDSCNARGQALLWQWSTTPPPTKTWRIGQRGGCDLKVRPSHGSGVAIDPKRRPVHLEEGSLVVPYGNPQQTDDLWQYVRIPGTPEHGDVPYHVLVGVGA